FRRAGDNGHSAAQIEQVGDGPHGSGDPDRLRARARQRVVRVRGPELEPSDVRVTVRPHEQRRQHELRTEERDERVEGDDDAEVSQNWAGDATNARPIRTAPTLTASSRVRPRARSST